MNLFTGAYKYFSTFVTLTMGPSLFKDKGAKVVKSINVQEGINIDRVQKSKNKKKILKEGRILQKINKRGGCNLCGKEGKV